MIIRPTSEFIPPTLFLTLFRKTYVSSQIIVHLLAKHIAFLSVAIYFAENVSFVTIKHSIVLMHVGVVLA